MAARPRPVAGLDAEVEPFLCQKGKEFAFGAAYPNLARWVQEFGTLEIGYDSMTDSFIRPVDPGGALWKGRRSYRSIDAALMEAEAGVLRLITSLGLS